MNNLFVPYQQSLDMKELGFDEPCFTTFDDKGNLRNPFDYSNSEYNANNIYIKDAKSFVKNSELTIENFNGPKNLYTQFIAAPTFSQAFEWFRENYNLIGLFEIGTQEFSYNIFDKKLISILGTDRFNYNGTYKEAELSCLKKLIEITKSGSLKA